MKTDKDGKYLRAIRYIARKEDFQKALTDQGNLRVIAVYPDGEVTYTHLLGYIQEAHLNGASWNVQTSNTKVGNTMEVVLI